MTTMLSANRRDADEVRPFHAPAYLFENLQVVLVDLIEFHPRSNLKCLRRFQTGEGQSEGTLPGF